MSDTDGAQISQTTKPKQSRISAFKYIVPKLQLLINICVLAALAYLFVAKQKTSNETTAIEYSNQLSLVNERIANIESELNLLSDKYDDIRYSTSREQQDEDVASSKNEIEELKSKIAERESDLLQSNKLIVSIALLRDAATQTGKFNQELKSTLANVRVNSTIHDKLKGLSDNYGEGIKTQSALKNDFFQIAKEILEEEDRLKSTSKNDVVLFLEKFIKIRNKDVSKNNISTSATIARAENSINNNKFGEAAKELSRLDQAKYSSAHDWINDVNHRLSTLSIINNLFIEVSASTIE